MCISELHSGPVSGMSIELAYSNLVAKRPLEATDVQVALLQSFDLPVAIEAFPS